MPCSTTVMGEELAGLYADHIWKWYGLPTKIILDRDPRFTSHFAKALCSKLGIDQNISSAYHPQTDSLTECKNQWVEQYLRFFTTAHQDDWDEWLPMATFAHNNWVNATTKVPPIEVILGYRPIATPVEAEETNVSTVEERHQRIEEVKEIARQVLNTTVGVAPLEQYKEGDQVWLEAKHLPLDYAMLKLAPRRQGPFKITKQISPVAYKLALPPTWNIHNVFHASVLTPYKETEQKGPNYV